MKSALVSQCSKLEQLAKQLKPIAQALDDASAQELAHPCWAERFVTIDALLTDVDTVVASLATERNVAASCFPNVAQV